MMLFTKNIGALLPWSKDETPEPARQVRARGRSIIPASGSFKRRFEAAGGTDYTGPWPTMGSINRELRTQLARMRGRSRYLAANSDYVKAFLTGLQTNVIGEHGIRLRSMAINSDGSPDTEAQGKIEKAWKDWGAHGRCTTDGRQSFAAFQRTAIWQIARDGEILVPKVENFRGNGFGFAVQGVGAEIMPENLNKYALSGNPIILGVEEGAGGRPVFYHVVERDALVRGLNIGVSQVYATRAVPADGVIHPYVLDEFGQTRGYPWINTAMRRLRMIGGYEDAALINARAGACKMAFKEQEHPGAARGLDTRRDDDPVDDDYDPETGESVTELAPGEIEELQPGVKISTFDPTYPSQEYDPFMKAMLRGMAAGMGSQYNILTGDLEGVNFSSLRQGNISMRDLWRVVQSWYGQSLLTPIFEPWLVWAITTGQVDLPIAELERWTPHEWQGRGWAWVDPLKEQQANTAALRNGTTTRTRIAADQGQDFEDILREMQREQELAAQYGITLSDPGAGDPVQTIEIEQGT